MTSPETLQKSEEQEAVTLTSESTPAPQEKKHRPSASDRWGAKKNEQALDQKDPPEDREQTSLQQPVWHVIVLGVLTFNLYIPYWVYKTFRDLKGRPREQSTAEIEQALSKYDRIPSALLSVVALIPFLNLALFASIFKDLTQLIPHEENFARRNPVFAALALTFATLAIWILGRTDGPMYLLFTLTCIPIAIAQRWINLYLREREPQGLLVRHAFSPLELLSIIVGALALALVVIGFSVKPT